MQLTISLFIFFNPASAVVVFDIFVSQFATACRKKWNTYPAFSKEKMKDEKLMFNNIQ